MTANRFGRWLAALLLFTHAGAVVAQAQTADLSVTITLTDPAIPPFTGISTDTDIVYDVVVTNGGPAAAINVNVFGTTPEGLSFVSNAGDCTSAYECVFASIASGESKTITSTYHVPSTYAPPTAVYFESFLFATTSDPNDENDFVSNITRVNGINCGNFSVSGGIDHTCAIVAGNGKTVGTILEDDLVECWGRSGEGQSTPPSGAFSQVSAGGLFTCGLRPSGAIECWGSDVQDQVTDTPVTTDFTQVDTGFQHACGLRSDNTVTCWGANFAGQTNAPGGGFTQVAAGGSFSCGLTTLGEIICWGLDADTDMSGDPIVTGGPTDDDFIQVAAGDQHVCGLHMDGSVDCWGSDFEGEAADNAGPFASITAGEEHNCGLRDDGTVLCWGGNDLGQIDSPGDAFTAIDAGSLHTCGLLSDGTILCWGSNNFLKSVPPGRSDSCPTCGDGLLEGRETCEACVPEFCEDTPTSFAACCSPVTCTAYRLSENHVCRDATGGCDAPEFCDGINFSSCPAPGPLRPGGFVCRAALGSCDPVETCTGTSNQCPANQPLLPSTAPCRVAAGSCDVQENCTGTSAACPTDLFVAAMTTCRAVAGVCDLAEVCSGSAAACPADAVKTSAVTCRTSVGVCDSAEVCSGAGTDCPADSFHGPAVTCRPSGGLCDAQELCSGSSTECPADVLASSITPCRAATGGCDAVERCTGTSNVCPADQISSTGTVCRGAIGVCDVAEVCAGTGKTCPNDSVAASTVTCRVAVDSCDVAERCTGASNTCPGNSFAVSGTACNDGSFCNGADTCNGSGGCTTHVGDPCPGPDGDGNCAETCNEAADNCSTLDPNGSSCADTDACTNGETCTAGVCSGGTVTECDDGDVCTFDTCDDTDGCVHLAGIEESGCLDAPKAKLFIKKNDLEPWESQLKWSWRKGAAVPPGLLGAPTSTTEYALCIFDRHDGGATLVGSYKIPAGNEGWTERTSKVVFSNKALPPDGIYKLGAKASDAPGKANASLKAAGSSLDLFEPIGSNLYLYHEPSVVAQLRNNAGACWTTEFFPQHFKKNWDNTVKAGYSE